MSVCARFLVLVNAQVQQFTFFYKGRIHDKTESGDKLTFYDLCGDGTTVQVIADSRLASTDFLSSIANICGYSGSRSSPDLTTAASTQEIVLTYFVSQCL